MLKTPQNRSISNLTYINGVFGGDAQFNGNLVLNNPSAEIVIQAGSSSALSIKDTAGTSYMSINSTPSPSITFDVPISADQKSITGVESITYSGPDGSNTLNLPTNQNVALQILDSSTNLLAVFDTKARSSTRFLQAELYGNQLTSGGPIVAPNFSGTYDHSTQSASCTGTTVTGVGTTFTSAMVGGLIAWPGTGKYGTITAFTSTTSLTLAESITQSAATFVIYFGGLTYDPTINQLTLADGVTQSTIQSSHFDTGSATTLTVGGSNATGVSIVPTTTFSNGVLAGSIDTSSATSMSVGTVNANAITIGHGSVPVTISKPVISSFTNGTTFTLPSTDGASSSQTPLSSNGAGVLSMSPLTPMFAKVTISSTTAIGTCNTTPILMLPNPGAGLINYVHMACMNYKGGSVAATVSENLWLMYGNNGASAPTNPGEQVHTASNSFGNHGSPTTSSANTNYLTYAIGGVSGGWLNIGPSIYDTSSSIINQGVYLTSAGAMSVGNPTAVINIWYSIISAV